MFSKFNTSEAESGKLSIMKSTDITHSMIVYFLHKMFLFLVVHLCMCVFNSVKFFSYQNGHKAEETETLTTAAEEKIDKFIILDECRLTLYITCGIFFVICTATHPLD